MKLENPVSGLSNPVGSDVIHQDREYNKEYYFASLLVQGF